MGPPCIRLMTMSIHFEVGLLSFTNRFPIYWCLRKFGREREEGHSQNDLCPQTPLCLYSQCRAKQVKHSHLAFPSLCKRSVVAGETNRQALLDPFSQLLESALSPGVCFSLGLDLSCNSTATLSQQSQLVLNIIWWQVVPSLKTWRNQKPKI